MYGDLSEHQTKGCEKKFRALGEDLYIIIEKLKESEDFKIFFTEGNGSIWDLDL
jgi:hypothetical protein